MHGEGGLKIGTCEFLLGVFLYGRNRRQSRHRRRRMGWKPQVFICVHLCLSEVILLLIGRAC